MISLMHRQRCLMKRSLPFTVAALILLIAFSGAVSAQGTPSLGGEVGYFAITTVPSGADVYFDDQYQGLSPVTVQVYSTGNPSHDLRVQKAGYEPVEEVLTRNPAAGETIPINIALTPIPTTSPTTSPPGSQFGYYRIVSVPAGGNVLFDGVSYGPAPVSVQVYTTATPQHTLIVTLAGYQQYTQQITGNPTSGQVITVTATLTPVQSTGNIYVNSNPSGATAYLDGAASQRTPSTFYGVTAGSHTLQIVYSGYQDYWTYPVVTSGQTTNVFATLVPLQNTGSLSVQSTPSGAGLYVDNGYRGETPQTIGNLVQGSHNVLLRLAGYQDYVTTVSITAGQTTRISPVLQPIVNPSVGYILVSSTPAGASIYLDGVYQGQTSAGNQYDITGVTPGAHSILLRLSGYQDYADTITISAGQVVTVNPTLVPLVKPPSTGSVQISSSPSGAETYLDNVFQGYTPLTLQNVAVGSHVVTLKLAGYNDSQTTIQVTAGQITQLTPTLTPVSTVTPTPTQSGSIPIAVLGALVSLGIFTWRKRQ
jgi:hypothetical protein